MSEIHIQNLTKRYGTTEAVDSVSLSIPDGATFGLVGPSGCGKSTLLRMIAGFEQPTAGDVRLDGASILDVSPQERDIGLVFQSIALFNNMSVIDNVSFGPRMRGESEDEYLDRARDILAMLGIADLEDRDPRNLSGGQQQRVALGRALAIEPEILLLDEPMTGLDAKLKRRLQKEMVELFADLDITAIHVTHDQEEAMMMCDQIAVLNDGSLEQVGTPAELYESPSNQFVADFIGTSNLLSATATGDYLDFGYTQVPHTHTEEGEVTVSIRPEHIESGTGALQAEITNQFYLGEKVRTYGRLPDDTEIVFDETQSSVHPGDEVALSLDTELAQIHPAEK
ncbi:ABC transporter ATP-binding protein [Halonotius sp. F2-221B]|uniref:ABC transporter ATP-binding protein n=1 Tax=Halonotius sp. F2-221B TaxID=2731620 RepID=UPI00398BA194